MRIAISPEAYDDITEILEWIARDNPQAALDQVSLILDAIGHLSEHPHRGRAGRVAGTRELVVAPYVIAYEVAADHLDVLRVRHGRQRWPRKMPPPSRWSRAGSTPSILGGTLGPINFSG